MYLIPAIDIIDGKCVRLTQGDYAQQKIYNEDPLAVAREFAAAGLTRLHLVDLDGARAGRIINYHVLEEIAGKTDLKVDFGGGLKTSNDIRIAFVSGAEQVTGGTIAVKDPETFIGWLESYGSERIILGSDVRNGQIAVSGWQESSNRELYDFLEEYQQRGILYTICTDVSKDGLLAGPATELYRGIRQRFPDLKLIASGGVSSLADLKELREVGCYGAIIGKAIYEGHISLQELADFS